MGRKPPCARLHSGDGPRCKAARSPAPGLVEERAKFGAGGRVDRGARVRTQGPLEGLDGGFPVVEGRVRHAFKNIGARELFWGEQVGAGALGCWKNGAIFSPVKGLFCAAKVRVSRRHDHRAQEGERSEEHGKW